VDWTFAPMIDLAFDPRWGRIAEGFGESPYGTSAFCVAAVKGFQGDDLGSAGSIAAKDSRDVDEANVEGRFRCDLFGVAGGWLP